MRSNLVIKIWDYRWFAFTSFAFLFRKKKYFKEKKQLVQDLIPPLDIYIHMCTLYTYRIYVCQDLVHLDCSDPPGVSSRLLGSHPSTCAVCVCVRVYTHSHTHTLPPALKIEKTQTTPLSFLLSKIAPHAKPGNKRSHRLVEPPHPHSPIAKWNKLHIHVI